MTHRTDRNDDRVMGGITGWIANNIEYKYTNGIVEHGGKIWRKPVRDHAREEITDLVIYFAIMEDQIDKTIEYLKGARSTIMDPEQAVKYIEYALNTLTDGNPEGEKEEELDGDPDSWYRYSERVYG